MSGGALTPKRPRRAQSERDAAIVAAYLAGQTRPVIAAAHGISPRTVSRVVAAAGEAMTPEERAYLHRYRQGKPGGKSPGRPREIALPEAERRHYAKVRDYCGAAAARRAFGLRPAAYSDRTDRSVAP